MFITGNVCACDKTQATYSAALMIGSRATQSIDVMFGCCLCMPVWAKKSRRFGDGGGCCESQ